MIRYILCVLGAAILCACAPAPHGDVPAQGVVTGIIVTGQSLSVGERGQPVVSAEQPFANVKLLDASPAPNYDGAGDDLNLVPLTAPIRPVPTDYTKPYEYPDNIIGETPGEGMANQLSSVDGRTVAITNVGETGHGLDYIEKGGMGRAYDASLYEVGAISRIIADAGSAYEVEAVLLVHGEADTLDPTYEDRVRRLRQDYDADIKAITHQARDVVLLMSPQSTMPYTSGPSISGIAEWHLAQDDPQHFILVGPKYQYVYDADGIHLTAPEYRRLGEKAAQALLARESGNPVALALRSARMLTPTSIAASFDVPAPPLQWDETISTHASTPAWANGRGFEVVDTTGPIEIVSTSIHGSDVVLTLGTTPNGTAIVSYAAYQDTDGYHGGMPEGRRGQLCDSDTFAGFSGGPQRNYAIPFSTTPKDIQ